MKFIAFLLGVFLLLLTFLSEGGRIAVLVQPVLLIVLTVCGPLFLSAKYGVKQTLRYLLGLVESTNGFVSDALFIYSALTALIFLDHILIALGSLSKGNEILGHLIAVALVALLYGIIFSIYLVTLKRVEHSEPLIIPTGVKASLTTSVAALTVTLLVLWKIF